MGNRKQIEVGIDFFKLIAAFIVVFAHTATGAEFGGAAPYVCKVISVLGVPFFFCCSGYFSSRLFEDKKFPWKPIKRLIVFYCVWSVIYLPFNYYSLKTYLLDFFIFGSFYHLWYMTALIFSIIFIWLIKNQKVLLVMSVLFLILGVLGSGYYVIGMKIPVIRDIISDFAIFDTIRRFYSIGVPFTFLGYFIAKNQNIIKALVQSKTALLLIISMILFLLEMIFVFYFELERDVFLTFFLLFAITAFFLRGLYLPLKNVEVWRGKAKMARSVSNCIYFIHPLIIISLSAILGETLFQKSPTLICFATFFISALIGYIILRINNPLLNRLIQ